jgi:DNA polymerase II large subunit
MRAEITKRVDELYFIANMARAKGYDPSPEVEIRRAKNLASRVEELVGPRGIAKELNSLFRENDREESSIIVAKKIIGGEFSDRKESRMELLQQALRTSLGVLTEGVLVAPIEGISGVAVGRNSNGSEYLTIGYAGPIRSAGGTAEALSVLIGDVIRREAGLAPYMATEQEIERWKEEISLYKRAAHLQYTPSSREIEIIVKNCPICIDGEGTEEVEVSGFRDLPRIKTNRLRGGACLVMAEGLCLKAPKIAKHVKNLGIDGWEFIGELIHEDGGDEDVDKYLKEIVAGRPIFSYPGAKGGFRLRYGRCRDGGLASLSINPATMKILGSFLAIGTQMKIEGPGKACIVTPCDEIEGPTVELKTGDVVRVDDMATADSVQVEKILDLGEILIPFGEFLENNKPLLPTPWVEEVWDLEAEEAGLKARGPRDSKEAVELAKKIPLPLHPDYTYLWHDLSVEEIFRLREIVSKGEVCESGLRLHMEAKKLLNSLLVPHRVSDGWIWMEDYHALLACLGLEEIGKKIEKKGEIQGEKDPIGLVSKLAGFEVRARAPSRIGARMGRPEKAAERRMSPPPHVLFPVGLAGGSQRLLNDVGEISVEVGYRVCGDCGEETFNSICPSCSSKTEIRGPKTYIVDVKAALAEASKRLGIEPGKVKGVIGLTSAHKVAERLDRGVIRSFYDIHVFKDGTCRYDMTDIPLTHFKPDEVGITIKRLKELGYDRDVGGDELVRGDQTVSMHPQDVVLPSSCLEHLLKVSKFVDDELVKIYGLEPFYGCSSIEDLYGHLVIALAPHTSAGIVGRIMGHTEVRGAFAHPFFHAAKRRNCDGDEDCVMLMLDGLINFSKDYLPSSRGGMMDVPLVLTTAIDPAEIDKEAHNIDLGNYPLSFYRASLDRKNPKELLETVKVVGDLIGGESIEIGFTHDTGSISEGVLNSAYKTLKTMEDKINAQLELARQIRAVDEADMAARVIESHLLPDLIGNLRAFSTQKFRCTKCNTKYRRLPLKGNCPRCGGNLTLTVHEASVKKYLKVATRMTEEYNLSDYLKQRIALIDSSLNSIFENERMKRATLEDFL